MIPVNWPQGSYGNFEHIFKDFSRTTYGVSPGLFTIAKMSGAEGAIKYSWGSGSTLSHHWVQDRALVGVLEVEPSGAPKILHFIVPENGLTIHIFPVYCSTKTQDKVIKIVTQCLSGVREVDFGSDSHMEKTYFHLNQNEIKCRTESQ